MKFKIQKVSDFNKSHSGIEQFLDSKGNLRVAGFVLTIEPDKGGMTYHKYFGLKRLAKTHIKNLKNEKNI